MKTVRLLMMISACFLREGGDFCADEQFADHVYFHAKVWTADDANPVAQAFATRGQRVIGVGTTEEMRALAGPDRTAMVDLQGHLVVPGFNDAHWHFASLRDVELEGAATLTEMQQLLTAAAKAHPGEPWILGRGWGYDVFPGRVPDKKYLDAILPDRPAFIWERDGHMGLANSKALQLAGITKTTKDPVDGRIEHDASGELTGELKEGAVDLVASKIPPPTDEQRYEDLKHLMGKAASYRDYLAPGSIGGA